MCSCKFICSLLLLMTLERLSVTGSGTTPHIKEVFIGRCFTYQSLAKQNKLDVLKTDLNCTALWSAFYTSFAYKDPCNITQESYKKLFDMLNVSKSIPNALFWSGSYELVSHFTFINDEYIVIGDTIAGYIADNLNWCGSVSSPDGMNHAHCPSKCSAVDLFWNAASAKFADRASGVSHVLLNASRKLNRPAYYRESTFRSVEMPRLKIDKLVVLVASSIGQKIRETCDSSSLLQLKADAKKKNMKIECIDQPELVLRIFCIKYPQANACAVKEAVSKKDDQTKLEEEVQKWKVLAITFSIVCVAVLLGISLWFIYRYTAHKSSTLQVTPTVKDTTNNNAVMSVNHGNTPPVKTNGHNNIWI